MSTDTQRDFVLHTRHTRGIYETEYGNAAYVSGPRAKTALDIDMGERIPMCMVTLRWIGRANDYASAYRY